MSDPYRYFRVEAKELVEALSKGVLALERGAGREAVDALLRHAHTLKGAARVVRRGEIADAAHALESALAPLRDLTAPPDREQIDGLLAQVDGMSRLVSAIDAKEPVQEGAKEGSPAAPAPKDREAPAAVAALDELGTVRVELGELDRLFETALAMGAQVDGLRREQARLERARRAVLRSEGDRFAWAAALEEVVRALGELSSGFEAELATLRGQAHALRLVKADALFPLLDRAVRDAAARTGKKVALALHGGTTRVSAQVLSGVRDSLLHAVRNAVAHGIESPEERRRAGKPVTGRVEVRVERRGGRVRFTCADDGRGLDEDRVRNAAAQAGLDPERGASALIFEAGLSTSEEVGDVAGRGMGLSVVREAMAALKGTASLESRPGQGATVVLDLPVSLSSVVALLFEVSGIRMGVPLESVAKSLAVKPADLVRSAAGEQILWEGNAAPFVSLARLLGTEPGRGRATLVLQDGAGAVALGVDRVLGARELVLRPLPPLAEGVPLLGGALDAEGRPEPVLDPAGIAALVRRAKPAAPKAVRRRPPVLVIDDSMTTRMLEQSILESAGYEVVTAASAEEGLEKARAQRFGVVVVDVEMPGMSGLEFVARTREDPALKDMPAIIVSSRGSAEDRRRGMEAGARAYLVKSEFAQEALLARVRELVG